jgi:hypothetical protein
MSDDRREGVPQGDKLLEEGKREREKLDSNGRAKRKTQG